ncbi:MAG: GWxTD domain-containing protein [Thermotogae bacterium]|nr:GWxTD domain-containing protein [Thermotogota bacterium]
MLFGQGLIFTVQQLFYADSTVVVAKMVAPARHFVKKRDTIRWRISLSVPDRCSRVEYRKLYVGFLSDYAIVKDSLRCSFEGEKFVAEAELSDENSGKVLRRVKAKSLKQAKDFRLSSLNYDYADSGVVLSLLISPRGRTDYTVKFGMAKQWSRPKMYPEIRLRAERDTTITFLVPKSDLSYGKVRFIAEVNGLRRETEALFNQFNIENDRDFKVLLSVLTFVFGPNAVKDLQKAPKERRREAWEEFWEKRGGKSAEEDFMERLYEAMRMFPSSFRAKVSDRALVYLKFGPPDEVESYPYRLEGKPYEVWHYYGLGKTFVFVDFDGSGDYRLVPAGYLDLMR